MNFQYKIKPIDIGKHLVTFLSEKYTYYSQEEWKNQIIEGNIGSLAIFDNIIFVGTQLKGIFCTTDKGKNWAAINDGITNLTIRRFCEFNKVLYVCTNDGFYSFNKISRSWNLEYGQNSLQTNGEAFFNGRYYLSTNKSIYTQQDEKNWIN